MIRLFLTDMNHEVANHNFIKTARPELLIPAASLEVLKAAVIYGADAVYIGGQAFSLRAKAKNFSREEMAEGIAFAHERGVAVHVTANILAHNGDLEEAAAYFRELGDLGPDALIIADPGMVMLAKQICPQIPIHISTQANNTNYMTYRFWHDLGAQRVVAARELSLREIREIREKTPADMEIECFIHGSMCISYSGRCLLSNYLTGRDANRGACTHPCRWKYAVMEETREGEYFPIYENERGTFLFNSGDLCMIGHIPELMEAGIDSFKIEGRMKTALYVATVARTYRRAIDAAKRGQEEYEALLPWCMEEIGRCTHRKFNTGFYFGRPDASTQIYDNSTYEQEAVYLGTVQKAEGTTFTLIQKNKFSVGEEILIMKPDGRNVQTKVLSIENEEGEQQESAPHAGQKLKVTLDKAVEEHDILRRDGGR